MIDLSNEKLSIKAQRKLLSINRSSWYYTPKDESALQFENDGFD